MTYMHRRERLKLLGFKNYEEYTRSSLWKAKRKEMLDAKISYSCYGCGKRGGRRRSGNLILHHTTYEHLGEEPLKDLVWMCNTCHMAAHSLEESGQETLAGCALAIRKKYLYAYQNGAYRKKPNGKPDFGGKIFGREASRYRRRGEHGILSRTAEGKAKEAAKCSLCEKKAVFNGKCFDCMKAT